jgi:hypothetical protein
MLKSAGLSCDAKYGRLDAISLQGPVGSVAVDDAVSLLSQKFWRASKH